MLKRFLTFLFLFLIVGCFSTVFAGNDLEISNKYFAFIIPNDAKGTYIVQKENNGINIVEKISANLGEGGFAFGLKIYKNPKDYADSDDAKKIGELLDKKGIVYDMVLVHPREIYYADGEDVAKNYSRLYDLAENVEIKGINGNQYFKNRGTKGEDLYRDILGKYKDGIKEKSDLKKIGYAYYDLNSDGIDELFIGKIAKGKSKGLVYEVYTMVDRKPMLVVSVDKGNKYFVCDDMYLYNEQSDTDKNVINVFILDRNSTKLHPHIRFINYKTPKKTWSTAYGEFGTWEEISEELFNQRRILFSEYKRFDFIPLKNLSN